jgi:hypothetical protein
MNASRRLIIGGLVAVATMLLAAGLIIGVGIAKAEPYHYGSPGDHDATAYGYELSAAGVVGGTPSKAGSLAATICQARAAGHSEHEMVDYAEQFPMSRASAIAVVTGAEYHFCVLYATSFNSGTGIASENGGNVVLVKRGGGRK